MHDDFVWKLLEHEAQTRRSVSNHFLIGLWRAEGYLFVPEPLCHCHTSDCQESHYLYEHAVFIKANTRTQLLLRRSHAVGRFVAVNQDSVVL